MLYHHLDFCYSNISNQLHRWQEYVQPEGWQENVLSLYDLLSSLLFT